MFTYYASELFPGSWGYSENIGIVFGGTRTPEMLAQEHAYYANHAANKEDDSSGWSMWSMWSKLQVVVVMVGILFLVYSSRLDSMRASFRFVLVLYILMVVASYKRQHYDPRPDKNEANAMRKETLSLRRKLTTWMECNRNRGRRACHRVRVRDHDHRSRLRVSYAVHWSVLVDWVLR